MPFDARIESSAGPLTFNRLKAVLNHATDEACYTAVTLEFFADDQESCEFFISNGEAVGPGEFLVYERGLLASEACTSLPAAARGAFDYPADFSGSYLRLHEPEPQAKAEFLCHEGGLTVHLEAVLGRSDSNVALPDTLTILPTTLEVDVPMESLPFLASCPASGS